MTLKVNELVQNQAATVDSHFGFKIDEKWLYRQDTVISRYFLILVPQPDKPDKIAADPTSWLALECGVTEKYSANGANAQDVPFAAYSNFNFMQAELQNGWFAIMIEADDQDDYGQKNLTKVCE